MDVEALWWTDSVHDYCVEVDGDLVVGCAVLELRTLPVGFAARQSVDREEGNDITVEAPCSREDCLRG